VKLNKEICKLCHSHSPYMTWTHEKEQWQDGGTIVCLMMEVGRTAYQVCRVGDGPPPWCSYAVEHIALWAAKEASP